MCQHPVPVLASKHHVVGGLAAKDGGAEVAPDHFELIGNVLPRGIDVGERLAERLLVVNAGRAGGAHQPRRKLGAAVRDRCRLEFVLLAKRERRHLAPLTEFPEHRHIAPQDELHLIDGRRDLGANLLGDRIVGRLAGRPAPLRRVADERIEHGLQRSNRRARYAAEENLAEGIR